MPASPQSKSKKKKKTSSPDGLPTLAIVGRPNVGKSTLFNRLVGSRRSIVGDEPGITRDRIYGNADWSGHHFRVVDTGGVIPNDEALIPTEIYRQAKVALEEADVVVMVVDARTELASPDIDLARLLIRGGKPLVLAVNKVDTPKLVAAAENFRQLGIRDVHFISAEHGENVAELLEHLVTLLPARVAASEVKSGPEPAPIPAAAAVEDTGESIIDDVDAELESTNPHHGEFVPTETKVAIIGRPNVGKSTLLNRLTGTERAIVSPVAGTTRDAVDELVLRDGKKYRFIDTAGIRRKGKTDLMAEKMSVVMARKHLEAADVALLVIDAGEGVTNADATIGGYAHESGRSVIIIINKWDLLGPGRQDGKPAADRELYEQQVRRALKFLDYAPMLFISAETGKNADKIFAELAHVAAERRKRVSTGQMNRFLKNVDFERATVPHRRKVRVYYMTQTNVAPPTFVLFTDRDVPLHFSYERFLQNQIRKAFGFDGSPIWIKNRPRKKVELPERKAERKDKR